MALVKIGHIVQKVSDNTAATATVTVRLRGELTNTQLYNSSGGTIGNPVTTSSGRIEAWVNEGRYDLVVSGAGFSTYTQEFEGVAPTLTGDITSAKVADGAITNVKVADNAITNAKLSTDAVTSDKIVDGTITMADLAASLQAYLVPSGSVLATARASAPAGYLLCDGAAVSRTTYAALFAAIGTAFNTGGEAGTDFRLPNFNGRSPMGVGTATGAGGETAHTLGQTMGEETHLNTAAQAATKSHGHGITDPGHRHALVLRGNQGAGGTWLGSGTLLSQIVAVWPDIDNPLTTTGVSVAASANIDATARSNVTHPVTVVNFIIKV